MNVKLFDKSVTEVPIGTVVARLYIGGVWHNYRCFVPKDGYYPEFDAERYKRELRSLGVSFPIEFYCVHEPPREEFIEED